MEEWSIGPTQGITRKPAVLDATWMQIIIIDSQRNLTYELALSWVWGSILYNLNFMDCLTKDSQAIKRESATWEVNHCELESITTRFSSTFKKQSMWFTIDERRKCKIYKIISSKVAKSFWLKLQIFFEEHENSEGRHALLDNKIYYEIW